MKSKACTAVDLISCPNALCSLLLAKYVLSILIHLKLDTHFTWLNTFYVKNGSVYRYQCWVGYKRVYRI